MKAVVIQPCCSSLASVWRREKVLHNKWALSTPTNGATVPETLPNATVIGVGLSAPVSLPFAICLHLIVSTSFPLFPPNIYFCSVLLARVAPFSLNTFAISRLEKASFFFLVQ